MRRKLLDRAQIVARMSWIQKMCVNVWKSKCVYMNIDHSKKKPNTKQEGNRSLNTNYWRRRSNIKTKTYANIFKKENNIPQARDLDYLKTQHEHHQKLQRWRHSLNEKSVTMTRHKTHSSCSIAWKKTLQSQPKP